MVLRRGSIITLCEYSGIKFFYSHTVSRDWPTLQRPRVRREKQLSDVLSVDEVRKLIGAVRTPHNRAYFWTVYSLGLRLGDGLHLQVGDIDAARMMVHVHHGKGAKDRYVPLPSSTLKILRAYWVRIVIPSGCSPPPDAITARLHWPTLRWNGRAFRERSEG
jgi:integrase/recombinase XerD